MSATLPGWRSLPPGCPVTAPRSALDNKTGSWRSERPVWNHDHCIKCGVCDMFCPEGCIKPGEVGYYLADLDYCKGCGICVMECPTQCIHMEQEEL